MPAKIVPVSKKGFTLIELMIAVSVVAILGTIGMIMFSSTQKTARDAKKKQDIEDVKKAMHVYQANYGNFCLGITGCTGSFWVNCTGCYNIETNAAIELLKPYLKQQTRWAPDIGLWIVDKDTFWLFTHLEVAPTATCSQLAMRETLGFGDSCNYCTGNTE